MIKINLLESVTERPSGAAMVEDRVSSPRIQTLLMAITVLALLVLGAGYDFVSAKSAQEVAQHELENQRRINQTMMAVNQEQAELERKAQDIQSRIDAIKRLRESQQGPGSVLREIKARFDAVPGLYLKSIEQKKANSRSEASLLTKHPLLVSARAWSSRQDSLRTSLLKPNANRLAVPRRPSSMQSCPLSPRPRLCRSW